MNELPSSLATLDLLTQLPDAVLATDLEGTITFWNAAAEKLYGWTAAEANGQSANDLLKTRFSDPFERIIDSLLREGRWEGEVTRTRKTGEPIDVLSRWSVLRNPQGGAVARIVIDTDLTETKFRFHDLQQAQTLARSQADLLFNLLDGISDLAYFKDPDGRYLAINQAAARSVGKTPQEIVGKDDFALFPPALAERVRAQDRAVLAAGTALAFQDKFLSKGQPEYIHTVKSICRDAKGKTLGVVGISRDITQQRSIELALQHRERDLREAHRIAKLGNWSWVREGDRVTWSDEVFRIFGRDPKLGEPGYLDLLQCHAPDSQERLAAAVEAAVGRGTPYELDLQILLPDGTPKWITARGEVEEWVDGTVAKLRGTLQDITDRKRIEEELRTASRRVQRLLDSISDGLAVIDPDWTFTYLSNNGARVLRVNPADVLGKGVWDLFPHAFGTKFHGELTRAMETRQPVHFEEFYPEPLNIWVECNCYPTDRGIAVLFHDITERVRTRQALGESESRFRKLFESQMIGIAVPDRFGGFKEGNDELLRMTGYTREDLEAGRVRWDVMTPPEYHPLDVLHIAEAAERGACTPYEKEFIRKDGTRVPILCGYALLEGSQDEYIGFVLDLTSQKRMEQALLAAEKLAMAGRFAASVAHEINNPLEGVTNALYLALQDPGVPTDTREYLTMAEQELSRVAHITTQTLRFHKQSKSAAPTNVTEIMDSALKLFASRLTAKKIAVNRECEPEAQINCFGDELRQVFANLISNSLDAMPEGGRMIIRITTARAWDQSRTPGVRIFVADTGAGVPDPAKDHIFEPFFSTKESTGVGLGLWVSEGIVRKHHGRITLRSRTGPSPGTVVAIFFPTVS
jgi:PAS domain S-box-containing protein